MFFSVKLAVAKLGAKNEWIPAVTAVAPVAGN